MGGPLVGRSDLVEALCDTYRRRSTVVIGRHGDGITSVLRAIADGVRSRGDAVRFVRLPDGRLDPTQLGDETLLVVDDAHRVDPAGLVVLQELAGVNPLVLGARGGAAPDGLSWLWRSGAVDRVELGSMPLGELTAMLEERAGGPLHRALVEAIAFRSGGRPGFAIDDIDSLVASGQLIEAGGLRRAAPSSSVGSRTIERCRDVLVELPSGVARDVTLLAVAGSPPSDALADLDIDEPELLRRGLAVFSDRRDGPLFRLDPPVLDAAVRATLSASAIRSLAEQIPGAVRRRLDPSDSVRLAIQLDEPTEIDDLVAAARASLRRHDQVGALRLAAAAASLGSVGAFVEAEILMEVGRRSAAADAYGSIADDESADPMLRARAAVELSLLLLWDIGRPDEAVDVASQLDATARDGPFEPLARAHLAAVTMYGGRPRDALALLDEVDLDALGGLGGDSAAMIRVASRGLLDPASVTCVGDLAPVLAGLDADGYDRLEAPIMLIAVLLAIELAGRIDDARSVLAVHRPAVVSSCTPAGFAWLALAEARIELAAGRAGAARRAAAEAWDGFADVNHPSGLRWAAGALLLSAAIAGDRPACRVELDRFGALAPGVPFLDADLFRARAWATFVTGDTSVAAALMSDAVELARSSDAVALEALALHDGFRLFRNGERARLSELATISPAPALVLRSRHVDLVAAGDAPGLVVLSEELERAGALLLAAEVASDGKALAAAAGLRSTARTAQGRVGRLVEACGGVTTPALDHPHLAGLTMRERDIAVLAADGLTSREIAARFDVSVRTVDNLLQRVYTKLGVNRRSDLAARLGGG